MVHSTNDTSPTLEVGPSLSARQRKAAAAITLGQLLGLAELRATARLPQSDGPYVSASSVRKASRSTGLNGIAQLRQTTAKRRADDEADAATAASRIPHTTDHGRNGVAAAVTAVGRKRIAILPPLGMALNPADASSLGCHLARRAGGRGGAGNGGSSSFARVYGGPVRAGMLPEDYAECFVGLEPVPDPEDLGAGGGLTAAQHPNAVAGMMSGAEVALAGAVQPGAGLLGSVGVGQDDGTSFLFPSASGALQQQQLQPGATLMPTDAMVGQVMGVPAQASGGGSMLDGFAQSAEAGLASMPYNGVLPYGAVTADGVGQGLAAPASAPDLMLDADDDGDDSSDGGDVDMDAGGGLATVPQGYPGSYTAVGAAGAGAMGGGYGFGGGVGGLPGGPGVANLGAPPVAAMSQDDALVEEF